MWSASASASSGVIGPTSRRIAAEVVEQPRALGRELREERGQGEDVRAPIIAAIAPARRSATARIPSAAPAITSVG